MATGEIPGAVQVGGEYRVSTPRDRVWEMLNDPAVLVQCIRRCETLLREDDGSYRAVFPVGFGPVKKRLFARLAVEETDPPAEYHLDASASLRALGNASGRARVRLHDDDGETVLEYHADISVDGWFARLGNDMLRAAADRAMARFFERFAEIVV